MAGRLIKVSNDVVTYGVVGQWCAEYERPPQPPPPNPPSNDGPGPTPPDSGGGLSCSASSPFINTIYWTDDDGVEWFMWVLDPEVNSVELPPECASMLNHPWRVP